MNQTVRMSFFRRLHTKKRPDLAINYESVLCFVKPGGTEDAGVALCVSSPPYAETDIYYAEGDLGKRFVRGQRRTDASKRANGTRCLGYGSTPGNLGNLSPGTLDLAITSPPYAGAGEVLGAHNGIDYTKTTGTGQRLTPGRRMQPYGTSAGQLGSMPPGDVP